MTIPDPQKWYIKHMTHPIEMMLSGLISGAPEGLEAAPPRHSRRGGRAPPPHPQPPAAEARRDSGPHGACAPLWHFAATCAAHHTVTNRIRAQRTPTCDCDRSPVDHNLNCQTVFLQWFFFVFGMKFFEILYCYEDFRVISFSVLFVFWFLNFYSTVDFFVA